MCDSVGQEAKEGNVKQGGGQGGLNDTVIGQCGRNGGAKGNA